MTIQQETTRQLVAFMNGQLDSQGLEEWIISIEQDESFSAAERESLADLRLLLLESGEGIRLLDHAKSAAVAILRQGGLLQTSATSSSQSVGSPTSSYQSSWVGSAA